MKSYYRLSFTLLGLILMGLPMVQAEDGDHCSEDPVAAISPRGECEVYANSCDVPGNWKSLPVSSCDEVQKRDTRPSLSEKMRSRRGFGGHSSYKTRTKAQSRNYSRRNPRNTAAIKRRVSSSSIYQSNKASDDKTNFESRRGRTTRNYRSRFANYGNRKVKDKDEVSETAKSHRRGRSGAYRRLADALRKDARRTGEFSNTPRWGVQTRTHLSTGIKTQNPYWKNPRFENRSTKKKSIIKVNPDGTLDEEGLREHLWRRNNRRVYHDDEFRNANLSGELDE